MTSSDNSNNLNRNIMYILNVLGVKNSIFYKQLSDNNFDIQSTVDCFINYNNIFNSLGILVASHFNEGQ